MARRTALVTSGALTIVVIAAIAAVAANIGLLRLAGDTGPVGRLAPGDLAPTAVVEQPATTSGTTPAGGQGTEGGTPSPARLSSQGRLLPDDSRFDSRRAQPGERRTAPHFEGRQDDD